MGEALYVVMLSLAVILITLWVLFAPIKPAKRGKDWAPSSLF